MSSVLTNRAQSAYHRTSHRSSPNGDDHLHKRPTTSVETKHPYTDQLNQAAFQTLESSTLSVGPHTRQRRPKTASSTWTTSTLSRPSRKLRSEEVESLLRSLDRDDTFIVQVDCLADYRTLVQTIDLRKTPLDCQLLYALQRRENRIVQGNACRDIRFRSLMDILQTPHVIEAEQNDSKPMETERGYTVGNHSNNLPY